ncbi:MAG: hypothetical protein JOZ07_06875 [Solirubrobacterales bacterium]|nr:hypothetical protein [Solirubrobacterales bacterium]
MEEKPGTPEPDKEQQHSDEEELEDLKAPSDSQEEVAGGCSVTIDCGVTCGVHGVTVEKE